MPGKMVHTDAVKLYYTKNAWQILGFKLKETEARNEEIVIKEKQEIL